jgi:hypothetical protein
VARQVLPIVGAVVGAFYGNPQLGYAIGAMIGNAVDPLIIKGPKLGEAGMQTSAEGVFRPIVMGTISVKGNVITRGNRFIRIKREKQGKGSGAKTENERVYWTWAIRICEAPIEGPITVLRVWQDSKLVYDATVDNQIPDESYKFWQSIRFYDGSETQMPDPNLEVYLGTGNAPAYRGTTYMVFPNWDLTDLGERIPDFQFEMSTITTQATWDYTWGENVPTDSGYQVGQVIYSDYWQRFVAAVGTGLRVSPDGVTPWVTYGGGNCFVLAEHPITKHIFVASGGTMYMSMDGGVTGSLVQTGVDPAPSAGMAYCDDLQAGIGGFFTMSQTRAWVSTSSGAVWNPSSVITGLGVNPNWVRLASGSFVAAGQNGKVFRSPNGLSGWVEIGDVGAPAGNLAQLVYEPWSDTIFACYTAGRIYRSVDGGNTWTLSHNGGSGVDYQSGISIPELQTTYINGSGSLTQNALHTEDGGLTWTLVPSDAANNWMAYAWAPQINTLVGVGAFRSHKANFSSTTATLALSEIVQMLCRRANLPDNRYNVSALTDSVDGIVFADDYTCADAIKALMPVFNFDSSEHDAGAGYKLHFPKRGRPVEHVFTIDDLVDFPDKTVRQDAYERPRVLHMAYQSPKVGYAPAKASPMRFSPDVRVVGEVSVQVPVAFSNENEAWRRADVILKNLWTTVAGEEEFTIPDSFLRLVPSDAIGVSLRGQVRRMLISEQRYENGTLVCKFMADRQSDYTSNLTGIPLPTPTPPPPSIAGPTIHWPMDLPAMNDNNDRLLSYHGATGQNSAWFGAQVDRSTDGGANFSDMLRFTQNTIMGLLVDPVTAASPHFTDTTNVVKVQLYSDDTIDTLTDQQFLSEGGSFALGWMDGDVRRWEVCQYRDAEQDSDGNWLLTTLARGRLNTDSAEHPAGSAFVLLDTVQSADNVTGHINQDLTYRATSLGNLTDGVPTYTEQYTGQSQREWPVAHLLIDRMGDTLNVRIVPRHRFGTEVMPVESTNWRGYRLQFQDDSDQIETFEFSANTYSFDASGMDFPVTVRVAQINRITGPGPYVSEVIA